MQGNKYDIINQTASQPLGSFIAICGHVKKLDLAYAHLSQTRKSKVDVLNQVLQDRDQLQSNFMEAESELAQAKAALGGSTAAVG